jgi:hypothetical protein
MTLADILGLLKLPVTEFVFRGDQLPPVLALIEDTAGSRADRPTPVAVRLIRKSGMNGFDWHYEFAQPPE